MENLSCDSNPWSLDIDVHTIPLYHCINFISSCQLSVLCAHKVQLRQTYTKHVKYRLEGDVFFTLFAAYISEPHVQCLLC